MISDVTNILTKNEEALLEKIKNNLFNCFFLKLLYYVSSIKIPRNFHYIFFWKEDKKVLKLSQQKSIEIF
jgi:hypothetical protein